MPLIIAAIDNEFAASTGANVNSGPGRSTFDYPPNGTKDLTIWSNPGDTEPYLFETGDSYDLEWGGSGGGTIEDATVIRTDILPGGGAVVVFEGADDTGETVQIVWTPGFDLEGWYWDNYTPSDDPGFWVTDQDPSTYQHICFAAESRIETAAGARRAGDLAVGDLVRTLDHGLQPIRWIGRRRVAGAGAAAPVRFAPGTIGNRAVLRLSPQHRVILAGPLVELYTGTPEVLAPAKALAARPGIGQEPCATVDYVHILLDEHELILAEGAECETLFLGATAQRVIDTGAGILSAYPRLSILGSSLRYRDRIAARPMLSVTEATQLVALLGGGPLVVASGAARDRAQGVA